MSTKPPTRCYLFFKFGASTKTVFPYQYLSIDVRGVDFWQTASSRSPSGNCQAARTVSAPCFPPVKCLFRNEFQPTVAIAAIVAIPIITRLYPICCWKITIVESNPWTTPYFAVRSSMRYYHSPSKPSGIHQVLPQTRPTVRMRTSPSDLASNLGMRHGWIKRVMVCGWVNFPTFHHNDLEYICFWDVIMYISRHNDLFHVYFNTPWTSQAHIS